MKTKMLLLSFISLTVIKAGEFLSLRDVRFQDSWKELLATPISVDARQQSALNVIKFVCYKAKIPYETTVIQDAKISVTLVNSNPREAFKRIHNQTGYEFMIERDGSKLVISPPRTAK